MKKQFFLIAFLSVTILGSQARAEDADDELVDYVSLAARLVQDGHYERARVTLDSADLKDEETDKKLYYLLRGLIALHQKNYPQSAQSFELAIKNGEKQPLVHINLARAYFGLEKYSAVLTSLKAAGPAARENLHAELLASRTYWELGRPEAALGVLVRARSRFPEEVEIPRLEISYLVTLKLFQELAARREEFIQRGDVRADDIAAISEALRQGGQLEEAKTTLETGRLRFPEDITLTVQLARVYMDQGMMLSSAILLEQAARVDPTFQVETAELYRRAGRLTRALLINARITDQKAKMKQRLQLLLELERYESVAAMESRLSRLQLLEDEQIRYALAYALFQIHDFAAAEKHLKRLTDPSLFKNGAELRKAIANCKSAGWACE